MSLATTSPLDAADYAQLQRAVSRWRWWRPLVTLVVFVVFAVVAVLIMSLILSVDLLLRGVDVTTDTVTAVVADPVGLALTAASLAVLIPVAFAATKIGFGTRLGWLASVAGRFRWRWALRCLLTVLPVWLVLMVVEGLLGSFAGAAHDRVVIMIIVVVLTIPLQAAGEEVAFRGLWQQGVGAWFRNRWLALIVPAVASVPLFALAHGATDGWVLADLAGFAAVAVYLTWRTGGLEAAIAVHVINNTVLMITTLALGGFAEGFVTAESQGSAVGLLISLVTEIVAAVLITWQAKRAGIRSQWRREPVPPPAADQQGPVGPVPGVSPLDAPTRSSFPADPG